MGKQSLKGFSAHDYVDDPITIISTQGAFYGASLPAAQIEAMIASHVPKKHISEVADVFGNRWWDYRRISPGHSFYLFTHHYYREIRTAARKFLSEQPKKHFAGKGMDRKDTYHFVAPALVQMEVSDVWERDDAHITGLWNAMLVSDALGIPYPNFVRLACRVAYNRLWKRIPRPTQLYSETLGALILEEWEKVQEQSFTPAKHPIYNLENYKGQSVQDAYREWLIERMGKISGNTLIPALMQVVYTDPQIPIDLAEKHFPKTALNRARLLAG